MKQARALAALLITVLGSYASQAPIPITKHPYLSQSEQDLPRLQYGLLTLHNTLAEPIDFALETSINARDPEREISIVNRDKKARGNGTIAAQTIQSLRTYPVTVKDRATQALLPIFGGFVMLKLKQQAEQGTAEYNGRVEEPGTYTISLDTAGQLALDKATATAETKANQ